MHRLAVAVLGALALAPAASAGAAPPPPRFAVTIDATLRTSWRTVDSWVRDDGCRFTADVSGWTAVAVHTRRRTVATFRRGQLVARVPLAGALSGDGGSGTVATDPCAETSVVDGRVLSGTLTGDARLTMAAGAVVLAGPPAWPAAVPWGPDVLGTSAAARLDPARGRLATAALRDRRRARLVASGRYDTVVRIVGDSSGDLVQEVRWTLTLRRLQPIR